MPDKLTDSEIVKAFEIFVNSVGKGFVFANVDIKKDEINEFKHIDLSYDEIFDLINRLQAENERLQLLFESVINSRDGYIKVIEQYKTENERLQKDKQPMIVNSIQDDFCGVPCEFMEEKINYLQEENKRFKADIGTLESKMITLNALIEMKNDTIGNQRKVIDVLECQLKTAKAEAYKEFAERLHEELRIYGIKDKFNKSVFLNVVDKAKKELEEK